MIKPFVGTIGQFLIALIIISMPMPSRADDRCQRLEDLHARYAGVELTSTQKQLKRQLVAWYDAHCRNRHIAGEG